MCIRTTGTLYCAARDRLFGSPVSAVISLIIDAPAESAASITLGFDVSMLIGTPNPLIPSITAATLSISSDVFIDLEPGLVDSPPISIISTPSAIKECALEIAASVLKLVAPVSYTHLTLPTTPYV